MIHIEDNPFAKSRDIELIHLQRYVTASSQSGEVSVVACIKASMPPECPLRLALTRASLQWREVLASVWLISSSVAL